MKHWISIVLLIVLSGLCMIIPASAWDIEGITDEWRVNPDDYPAASPYDIVALEDGTVWMTTNPDNSEEANDLFTLDYPEGVIQGYTAPFRAHFVTLDVAQNGTIWIADRFGSLVQFFPSTKQFEKVPPSLLYVLYPRDATFYGVKVAPDGNIWFTIWSTTPCIGVYRPGARPIDRWDRYDLPEGCGNPVELDFEDDGTVWFTLRTWESDHPGLGRLDPATGDITTWTDWTDSSSTLTLTNGPLPRNLVTPWGIMVDGHDPAQVWFTDKNAGLLILFEEGESPDDGVATWYDVYDTLLDTHFIAQDPEGDIWLSAFGGATVPSSIPRIGVFDPDTADISTMDVPSGHSPMDIAISPFGEVWWVNTASAGLSDRGGIGRFIPFIDKDGDSIDDRIDIAPGAASTAFRVNGTYRLSGNITKRGTQRLTITKANPPYGVRIIADPIFTPRPKSTTMTVDCQCGLQRSTRVTLTITDGDDFILTCGRKILVLKGSLEVAGTWPTTPCNVFQRDPLLFSRDFSQL